MHRTSLLLPFVLLLAAACHPAFAATPSATPFTGGVVEGRLPNGVRWVVLPRRTRDGGVGVVMRVEGGFLAERRPGERGVAHLIEHLAYNSPTTRDQQDAERFRTVGMPLTLPEPAGATTTWRASTYFLVARRGYIADIAALLGLYREVASELRFRSDLVDRQRQEVLREMAERRQGNLTYARYVAAVAPGTATDVIDAQNSDDVAQASLATITTLYRRLYRPETTTIAIVGDVDATAVAASIKEQFGDWRSEGVVPPASIPTLAARRVAPVSFAALPQGRSTAMLTVALPTPPLPAGPQAQADALLLDMVTTRAVTARLRSAQPHARPGKTGGVIDPEQGYRLVMLWDDYASGDWRPALARLASTACALSTWGFADDEWSAAKAAVLRDLEARVEHEPNIELAKTLVASAAEGRALTPPATLLARARTLLDRTTAAAGSAFWRSLWTSGTRHVRVEGAELIDVPRPVETIRAVADGAVDQPQCKVGSG